MCYIQELAAIVQLSFSLLNLCHGLKILVFGSVMPAREFGNVLHPRACCYCAAFFFFAEPLPRVEDQLGFSCLMTLVFVHKLLWVVVFDVASNKSGRNQNQWLLWVVGHCRLCEFSKLLM